MSSQLEWLRRVMIGPLLEECPDGRDQKDFLDGIFNVKHREICVYRANKEFQLPGTFLEGGVHAVEGAIVTRTIRRSEIMVVRKDAREAFYDLEHDGRTFRLTRKQWNGIESVLKKTRGQDEVSSS